MSKTITLRSKFLNVLNESLQKFSIENGIKILKNPFMEADGNFTSVIQTNNTFNPSDINSNIMVDDKKSELDPELSDKKDDLIKQATETITQTLQISDHLQSILNQINKINKDMGCDEWKINEEGNTATLKNKNARIFKQNDNLCLSHNGDIEIFKNVAELHNWLKENDYPLPHNIKLHEDFDPSKSKFGKFGEWLDVKKDIEGNDLKIGDKILAPGETEDMTPEERKALYADLQAKDMQKPIFKMGRTQEKEMRHKLPKEDVALNQYTPKELGHILYNKPLDKQKLGKSLQRNESINEETGFWYLQYEDYNHDQFLYLNDAWREGNLLTNSLDQASAFMSEEDALKELDEVYTVNNTQYPFKPIQDGTVNECFGTSTGSLGSAVQFLGDKKKDKNLSEDLLDEDNVTKLAREIGKKDPSTWTDYEQEIMKKNFEANQGNRIKMALKGGDNAPHSIYKNQPDSFLHKDVLDTKNMKILNTEKFIERCQKWVDHLEDRLKFNPRELIGNNNEYLGPSFFGAKGDNIPTEIKQLAKQRSNAFYKDFIEDFWQWDNSGAKEKLFGNMYYNFFNNANSGPITQNIHNIHKSLRTGTNTRQINKELNKGTATQDLLKTNIITKDIYNRFENEINANIKNINTHTNDEELIKILNEIDNSEKLSDEQKRDFAQEIHEKYTTLSDDGSGEIPSKWGNERSDDCAIAIEDFIEKYYINDNNEDDDDYIPELDDKEYELSDSTNLYDAFINNFNKKDISLKEDDSPADFASGFNPTKDATTDANIEVNSSSTQTSTPDIDIPDMNSNETTDNKPDVEFGDINVSSGNYGPEDNEEQTSISQQNMPEYRIVDVLVNDKDETDVKVKVQDTKTGKIEIKNLYDIDI